MAQYRTDRNPHDLIFARRDAGALRGRPAPGGDDDPAGGGGDACSCRSTRAAAAPGSTGSARATRRDADGYQTAYLWEQVWQRDAWLDLLGIVRPRRGRAACCSRGSTSGTRSARSSRRPAATGPGWTGWSSTRPGRASPTRSRGPRTRLSRLHGADDAADLRQGRRHHRPQGARPAAAGDRRPGWSTHPGTIVRDRREVRAAQGGAGGQRGAGHHHDPAEVPGRGRARREGRRCGEAKGVVGRRFAVIVDEAHSSTTGDSVAEAEEGPRRR